MRGNLRACIAPSARLVTFDFDREEEDVVSGLRSDVAPAQLGSRSDLKFVGSSFRDLRLGSFGRASELEEKQQRSLSIPNQRETQHGMGTQCYAFFLHNVLHKRSICSAMIHMER